LDIIEPFDLYVARDGHIEGPATERPRTPAWWRTTILILAAWPRDRTPTPLRRLVSTSPTDSLLRAMKIEVERGQLPRS
jgi:hypothetical protein